MALDLVILGREGKPERAVSISVEVHSALMDISRRYGLALFARLDDYYRDVEFQSTVLDVLARETEKALAMVENDSALALALVELRDLISEAQVRKISILALAD